MKPEITQRNVLSTQVCVPKDFTDKQVNDFAEKENPCGTANGWIIRKKGDPALYGADERVKCADREDFIHVMLDA